MSGCTSRLFFFSTKARLNVRNGGQMHMFGLHQVTFCPGLEPKHLGCNYNFNFITIKAMTSFVALKRKKKHKMLKKLQPLQSAAEPSCSVYTRELRLRRPADHLMWFPCATAGASNVKVSVVVLRNGHVSVLTDMHVSAACQEKKPTTDSFSKTKQNKRISNIELLLHTQATLCFPLQEQEVTDWPSKRMCCILNNFPGVDGIPEVKKLPNLTKLCIFIHLFFS